MCKNCYYTCNNISIKLYHIHTYILNEGYKNHSKHVSFSAVNRFTPKNINNFLNERNRTFHTPLERIGNF